MLALKFGVFETDSLCDTTPFVDHVSGRDLTSCSVKPMLCHKMLLHYKEMTTSLALTPGQVLQSTPAAHPHTNGDNTLSARTQHHTRCATCNTAL